jgi:hypothetical protein
VAPSTHAVTVVGLRAPCRDRKCKTRAHRDGQLLTASPACVSATDTFLPAWHTHRLSTDREQLCPLLAAARSTHSLPTTPRCVQNLFFSHYSCCPTKPPSPLLLLLLLLLLFFFFFFLLLLLLLQPAAITLACTSANACVTGARFAPVALPRVHGCPDDRVCHPPVPF